MLLLVATLSLLLVSLCTLRILPALDRIASQKKRVRIREDPEVRLYEIP
jgi:uncharacterized membrane protein YsdA (DUF1294 family)